MTAQGDCYQAAALKILEGERADLKDPLLVHGLVDGQGRAAGLRFGHAWVEYILQVPLPGGDSLPLEIVLDPSNGREIHLPRTLYYRVGKIREEEVMRYSREETREALLLHEHYGPWTEEEP